MFFNKVKHYIFKTACTFALLVGVFSVYGVLDTQKAHAQWLTADLGNIVQNTISAGADTEQAVTGYTLWMKEFILDGLIKALLNQILQQLTASIVNWINSGFDGNPSFIENPESFFGEIGSNIVGEFIDQHGDLFGLCSPFNLDVRLALAFKYKPYSPKKYACTLNTIISNVKNANATINGFTAGDFSQGGWPAFVSLTTEPQNNIYGSYLTADSDIQVKIGKANFVNQQELNQGRGFLSWKKCTRYETVEEFQDRTGDYGREYTPKQKELKCAPGAEKTETPGSVIQEQLNGTVLQSQYGLTVADEVNEILNALFAQIAKQILVGGLKAITGSGGASNSASYSNQLMNEQPTQVLTDTKASLLSTMEKQISQAATLKANKLASLTLLIETKNKFEAVKDCWLAKNPQNATSTDPYIQAQINAIDQIMMEKITATTTRILAEEQAADSALQKLNSIKDRVNAAKTVNDMNGPATEFNGLLTARALPTDRDVVLSKAEIDDVKASLVTVNELAAQKMLACKAQ